nr:hypothetical protein [Alphaproteobacteria bacterium]
TTISYENGDTDHTKTPISYALFACINDDEANHTDDRNFYLDIMKLLVNEKTDWNAKDSISSYYGGGETSTIADTLEWIGEEKDKPKCIEAADYVKNHLKENNITITE